MKNRKTIILFGLLFIPLLIVAQEEKISSRIGFDLNFGGFWGKTLTPERVRPGQTLRATGLGAYSVGIKYEQFFCDNQLGFAVGLRVSQYSSSIRGEYRGLFLFVPIRDFFYWQFHQEGVYTDYLKINKITQKNNYLGIPLELRYFPKKGDFAFKTYLKIGVALNYLLSSSNSIEFANNQMDTFSSKVEKQMEQPNSFHSYIYPAFGMKFGKNHRTWFNMEFHFPGFLVGKKHHPFIQPGVGLRMQLALQIPLKKQNA